MKGDRSKLIFVWPILPGKEEAWRRAMQEIQEFRVHAYAESRRLLGIQMECIQLAASSRACFSIVTIGAHNHDQLLQGMAASTHPFDRWFRSRVLEYHGVDLSRGLSVHDAEVIMVWEAPSVKSAYIGGEEETDPSGSP